MHNESAALQTCSLPEPLDDLALLAAVDQEASDEVVRHISECPACAARAAHFARLQTLLRARLYRMFCPTSDDLAAFHAQMLPPDRRAELALHICACPHCASELRLLDDLLSQGPDGSDRAPPGLLAVLN
jgi:anti-sigma factor RsiW